MVSMGNKDREGEVQKNNKKKKNRGVRVFIHKLSIRQTLFCKFSLYALRQKQRTHLLGKIHS